LTVAEIIFKWNSWAGRRNA